jgi:phage terminase large subunit-like protein
MVQHGHVDWIIWLILAGRGWGKTRTGAEDVVKYGLEHPGSRIALVAPTYGDGRDTMVEGESGIMSILPQRLLSDWNRSIGELILTNGTRMKIFTAERPERLRGPQHHRAWCEELAAWEYLQDTWDMLMFGLRLGQNPQVVITTTPKPLKFIRRLIQRGATPAGGVVITRGSTFENARNLARATLQELREAYQGTRLGRQELDAEVLEDVEGALWRESDIEDNRLQMYLVPDEEQLLGRVVVAVDPAVTSNLTSDETGIVVVGLSRGPCPLCYMCEEPHGFVLEDASGRYTPGEWGARVVQVYDRWKADRVVAEVNNGGDLVITNLNAVRANLPTATVRASKGKYARAEPVAALYERRKIHHLGADFGELEEQMLTWTAEEKGWSPDRMDALVWGLSYLMVPSSRTAVVAQAQDTRHRGRR